jgi:hypothetical protein
VSKRQYVQTAEETRYATDTASAAAVGLTRPLKDRNNVSKSEGLPVYGVYGRNGVGMKRFYVVMRGERQNPEDSYTAIVEAETSKKVGKKALKEFKTALGPLAKAAGKLHILVVISTETKIEGFGWQCGMGEG